MKKYTNISKISDNKFLNLFHMHALTDAGRPFDYFFVSRRKEDKLKLYTKDIQAEEEERAIVRRALEHPIGSKSLKELTKDVKKILIITNIIFLWYNMLYYLTNITRCSPIGLEKNSTIALHVVFCGKYFRLCKSLIYKIIWGGNAEVFPPLHLCFVPLQ